MFFKLQRIVTITLLVQISTFFCAQERPLTDTNYIDKKGRKQGIWKKIDTTRLSYIGQFKDDKPYGRFTYFDKYGQIAVISDFFRESFATQTTYFYPNGKIRAIGFYLDKLKDSTWKYYDTIGRILKTEHYLNGMLHGLTEVYDHEGNCIESQEWYRNQRNGIWWEKTDKGTQSVNYKFNYSHGPYNAYYPNNKPAVKGFFEDGEKEKKWYFYHQDSLLDRILYFKDNKLIKKMVSIQVNGEDLLILTDSVAYIHTTGKITEVKMLDGKAYRPVQNFEQLVKSFELDDFFLATPRFLVSFTLYDSMEMLPPEDDEENIGISEYSSGLENPSRQKAILKLKIKAPYELIIDADVIGLLQVITSPKPIEEFE